ncbi:hypothetical protein OF83DRAFT_1154194 [Amylostereum chailletii]|nr:hypothetical protein OF83DRAFT_1154194 [Amylostereum chailletii]
MYNPYASNGYRDQLWDSSNSMNHGQGPSIPAFEVPNTPSNADLAAKALEDEANYRFPSFSANDAVTLGLSLRKRFRGSSRHQKLGKGLVISIQTVAGHTLFSCTVGDLGTTIGDVSLESWANLEGMMAVVRRTGHSSFYVEKGMGAMGKTPRQLGIPSDFRIHGGAFPIWLENALCCPIAIVGCYSGSSDDDHRMVVTSVRDYLRKMSEEQQMSQAPRSSLHMSSPGIPQDHSTEWMSQSAVGKLYRPSQFEDDRETERSH